MRRTNGKTNRLSASWILSILCVLVLMTSVLLPASRVSAADMLKMGVLQEPKTLNIWRAGDRWSLKILGLIYQSLYIRDPKTLDLVPWLAAAPPEYDAKNLCYTVKLRPARWSDGTELTSEDVAFTGRTILEFKVPRYLSKWKFIKKIETPDKQTVKFYLSEPQAIFVTRTLTTPIVQKKQWEDVITRVRGDEKPLRSLLRHKMKMPIGSGPFALKDWRSGAYIYVIKNNLFFGSGKTISGHLLGPYIDGIIFKVYGTSDAAILALKKGSIDMFWWGIQPGYMEDLKANPEMEIFTNEKSALYYLGFNVRKPPFNDVNLRRTTATLVGEDFIIKRILQGYGVKMYSIIPPGNTFWYCPDVPKYGVGLTREERIKKAYKMLSDAGYTWQIPPIDNAGNVVNGEGIMTPDGKLMEQFTILTPPADYDPHRAMCGMMMQEWLRMLGIPAYSKPMAFGALIEQVKVRREFEAFILGYGSLSLDPDYLRNFFISTNNKPRGWNMSGYNNPAFDKIANKSAETMDRDQRRKLIWEMQKIIMGDVPYMPLYNPKLIEATRKGKFAGWVQMLGGIGNLWSFCQLKPL
ncbi:bacterial extracellular solute-binding protein, family 5 [delta proteobacterium NaphS2]|nr:bacterial extracellular solute-binding protein, family 5 [delta proteobacterium NaphS2]